MKPLSYFSIPLIAGMLLGCCTTVAVCIVLQATASNSEIEGSVHLNNDPQNDYIGSQGSVRLSDLLEIDSPFNRRKYLNSLSRGWGKANLIALIEESLTWNSDPRLQSVQNLLFVELARIDSEGALEKVWELPNTNWRTLVSVVFSEWSKSNFSVALSKAASLSGYLRHHAIRVVLVTRSDLAEPQRLLEARKYGVEFVAESVLGKESARALLHQPKRALEKTLTDSIENNFQLELLLEIVQAWVAIEGSNVLLPLFELLQTHSLIHTPLQRRLVAEATRHDYRTAWEDVQNFAPNVQEILQPAILDAWIASDVSEAFLVVSQLSDSVRRRELRDHIEWGWSVQKPSEVLENLDSILQENRYRVIANAIRKLARLDKYEDAVQYLQQLDLQDEDTRQAKEFLIAEWSRSDAAAALDWVIDDIRDTEETNVLRQKLLREVLVHFALVDPTRALEVARAQPENESIRPTDRLEYSVIQSLASNGLFDVVLPMMREIPDSARLHSFLMVGKNLIDFNLLNEAVELGRELPPSSRPDYFRDLTLQWLSVNPDHLVVNLPRIPDTSSRIAVAQQVVRFQGDREYLSTDQLQRVISLLEPRDEH